MSLPAMLAAMSGGSLPPLGDLIKIPCAHCLVDDSGADWAAAMTIVNGTAMCGRHARRELHSPYCNCWACGPLEEADKAESVIMPAVFTCPRCDGCGQIADTDEGEPWTAWQRLPPPSGLATRFGLVKPIPCPQCRPGAGK